MVAHGDNKSKPTLADFIIILKFFIENILLFGVTRQLLHCPILCYASLLLAFIKVISYRVRDFILHPRHNLVATDLKTVPWTVNLEEWHIKSTDRIQWLSWYRISLSLIKVIKCGWYIWAESFWKCWSLCSHQHYIRLNWSAVMSEPAALKSLVILMSNQCWELPLSS